MGEKSRDFTVSLPPQRRVLNAVVLFSCQNSGHYNLFAPAGRVLLQRFYHLFTTAVQGFWQGFAGRKVKVPAIPRSCWGDAWCIYFFNFNCILLHLMIEIQILAFTG